jgi:hypothetical protein
LSLVTSEVLLVKRDSTVEWTRYRKALEQRPRYSLPAVLLGSLP